MATQTYDLRTPRVGKIAGEILAHAVPVEVLGIAADSKRMPKNKSDTMIFRRWLPYGGATTNATTVNTWSVTANAHLTQEGVTPTAETLTPQDITVQLNQYACLYMYTDKTAVLYEDNVPDEMKVQTGERMGLVREMIRWGTLQGCTNAFYAGGTTRATVDEAISLGILRNVSQTLRGNRGKTRFNILSASPNYNTSPVEAGFIVFAHTAAENDIRELPGFIPVAAYGSRKTLSEYELGSVESFRFILSPELSPILAGGAAIGATGLVSAGATSVDIYPYIVVAAQAFADVALRGMESFDVIHIPHTQKDKSDPLGQKGYVGASFWSASFIQNDGWMATIEAGVTDL